MGDPEDDIALSEDVAARFRAFVGGLGYDEERALYRMLAADFLAGEVQGYAMPFTAPMARVPTIPWSWHPDGSPGSDRAGTPGGPPQWWLDEISGHHHHNPS